MILRHHIRQRCENVGPWQAASLHDGCDSLHQQHGEIARGNEEGVRLYPYQAAYRGRGHNESTSVNVI